MRTKTIVDICQKLINLCKTFFDIFFRLTWGLKQISWRNYRNVPSCPFYETFRQRSGLKVTNEQTHFFQELVYTTKICLFDLILYVPANNLSVTLGRVFLG